ncbi:uncharacterized protein BXZ73DRAFT_52104 [Epithele typhae]|uniref:uncharacterized protein n=1 Tax=Epithele typhae TaxID=378194 RepID=UPI00200731B5|nr:uncharacterized protein BXZ73DRAFT_52104 [Epithele typhae]KAH9920548.1 hypothetical protein BXZ73DRAFT_52104 [Epithele typhae]
MPGKLFYHSFYIVNFINAVLFGIELVLFYSVVTAIHRLERPTRFDKFLYAFSTVLVILSATIWITQTYFGEVMFVTHVNYPGGMMAYWDAHSSVWYNTWGIAACIVSNLMSDALLVHRCYIIWNDKRIMILPILLWISSLAFGIGILYGCGRPGTDYFSGITVMFVNAYTATTFAFNVVVTSCICFRIIAVSRTMRHAGYAHSGDVRMYTGVAAIFVESALPFTIFSFIYLVTYAVGSDIAYLFSFYIMFTGISPLMIAHRIFSRCAWTRSSATLCTSGTTTTLSSRGGHGADLASKGPSSTGRASSAHECALTSRPAHARVHGEFELADLDGKGPPAKRAPLELHEGHRTSFVPLRDVALGEVRKGADSIDGLPV